MLGDRAAALRTIGRLHEARSIRFGRLRVTEKRLVAVALCSVFLVGGWLRFSDTSWDRGEYLHPDERYLSTVADNINWPSSPISYLNVHTSPLSPYNTQQGQNLVYGTLPIFATKIAAAAVGDDYYGRYYVVARRLSALLDLGTMALTFLLARLLLSPLGRRRALWGGILAAALYACTVTAVQFSHYGTVESWLVFFATLTTFLAARAAGTRLERPLQIDPIWVAVGVALGFTVACKVSGAFVALPVLVAALGRSVRFGFGSGRIAAARRLTTDGVTLVIPGYLAYRLVSPYTFANSFWLNFSISPALRSALQQQQDALNGKSLYPPAYQWLLSRPIWSPLKNLVVWQLGTPLGVAALAGVALLTVAAARLTFRVVRRRRWNALTPDVVERLTLRLMVIAFVTAGFFPFARLFAHTGRYLVPLAPLLVVSATWALVRGLGRHIKLLATVSALVVIATGAYAVAFHSIYDRTNTRVASSRWIVAHVPRGSTIANEAWDDSIPVGSDAQRFRGESVPVWDPDDGTKIRKLYDALAPADYYFLSSPRAWRTIGRLPDRFPLMVRFYSDLFAGRLGFREAASFRSLPSLLGVKINDLDAEEAFWVYDHPPVRIFRHTRKLTYDQFRRVLCTPPQPAACT